MASKTSSLSTYSRTGQYRRVDCSRFMDVPSNVLILRVASAGNNILQSTSSNINVEQTIFIFFLVLMINTQLANQTFLKLSQQPENRVCFECGAPQPTWASLPNAIFLCLTCAGEHRALGVHVSYVRSLTLDDWTEKQLSMMMLGGNLRL